MSHLDHNSHYQSLNEIISGTNSSLHELHKQAANLQQLQQQVSQLLPKQIASHCRVTKWQQGKLTIGIDNAAYITQLRYTSNALRDALRSLPAFANLSHIEFKVIPTLFDSTTTTAPTVSIPNKRTLSCKSTQLLKTVAQQLKNNPNTAPLHAALTKLVEK